MRILFKDSSGALVMTVIDSTSALSQSDDPQKITLFQPSFHDGNHVTVDIEFGSTEVAQIAWSEIRNAVTNGGAGIDLTVYQ